MSIFSRKWLKMVFQQLGETFGAKLPFFSKKMKLANFTKKYDFSKKIHEKKFFWKIFFFKIAYFGWCLYVSQRIPVAVRVSRGVYCGQIFLARYIYWCRNFCLKSSKFPFFWLLKWPKFQAEISVRSCQLYWKNVFQKHI